MRRRTPVAFAGFAVVILAAVIGFASFTTERPTPPEPASTLEVPVPGHVSGRLTAAILSSRLSGPAVLDFPTVSIDPPRTTEAPPATPASSAPQSDAFVTTNPPTSTTTPPAASPPAATTTIPPPTVPITQPPVTFRASVEQWRPLVATYFPSSLLDPALSVMECESGGDPNAQNPNSTASGLYQFIASTWNWASANAGFTGVSVYDPEANIATAAFLVEYSVDRGLPPWQHWVCQPDIPS